MNRTILITCLLLICSQLAFTQSRGRDVVYLKNGSIIKGIVTEMTPDENLKIKTNDGSLFVYKMSEVDKVTKDQSSTSTAFHSSFFEQNPATSGYKGFISAAYTVGTGDYSINRFELTTSHGYAFNPYLFIGAGTGVHIYHNNSYTEAVVPIFADFRANFTQGPIVPTLGLKMGYSLDIDGGIFGLGFYAAPMVGARFQLENEKAIHIGLGYTAQMTKAEYYYYSENVNMGGITFKVEFEF